MRAKIQKTRYLQLPATNFFVPLQYENRNYCGNGQGVHAAQVHCHNNSYFHTAKVRKS